MTRKTPEHIATPEQSSEQRLTQIEKIEEARELNRARRVAAAEFIQRIVNQHEVNENDPLASQLLRAGADKRALDTYALQELTTLAHVFRELLGITSLEWDEAIERITSKSRE